MRFFLIMTMAILTPSLALANFNNFRGNCWGSGMGMFGGGGGFMMIGFWIVVLILLFLLVKELIARRSKDSDSANQILKERFAKGEITQSEYQEMKKLVRK
jgi:putative membrane protein